MAATTTRSEPHKLRADEWAEAVPAALRSLPRWCGYANGSKAPLDLRTGKHARVDDPSTFGTFAEARRFYAEHEAEPDAGAGFVFTKGDGLVFVDLDHLRDPETGSPGKVEKRLADLAGQTYVEVSPSGAGFHVFAVGELPRAAGVTGAQVDLWEGRIEAYGERRFSTVTGWRLEEARPDVSRAGTLDELLSVSGLAAKLQRAAEPTAPAEAPKPAFEQPAPTPRQLFEDFRRLPGALAVLAHHYQAQGDLGYREWTENVVMPLQGTFGGTAYWPVVREWFGDFTRQLPGYRRGDESKLEKFSRTDSERRTVASIYGLADRIDPQWRHRGAEERERTAEHIPLIATPGGELLARPVRLPEYVFKPHIPRGRPLGLFAPGGSLKSAIGLDAALAVATGQPWGGLEPTRPGRSLFASKEQPLDSIRGRIEAWLRGAATFGLEGRELEERMRELRALIEQNLAVLGSDSPGMRELFLTRASYTAVSIDRRAVDDLRRLCEGRDLAFLDPFALLSGGPENSNEAGAEFVGALGMVADVGPAVLVAGHVGKDPKNGQYVNRGASSVSDHLRGVFSAERLSEAPFAPVRLTHEKPSEDGPRGAPLAWEPKVWRPATTDDDALGYIYLWPTTVAAAETGTWRPRLMAAMGEAGADGMTKSDVTNLVRKGGRGADKERAAMREALRGLIAEGRVTETRERHADDGPAATVYHLSGERGDSPPLSADSPPGKSGKSSPLAEMSPRSERGTLRGLGGRRVAEVHEIPPGASARALPRGRLSARSRRGKSPRRVRRST